MRRPFFFFYMLLTLVLAAFHASSETAEFDCGRYGVRFTYNRTTLPGDAVFVRAELTTGDTFLRESFMRTKGSARIEKAGAEFYEVSPPVYEIPLFGKNGGGSPGIPGRQDFNFNSMNPLGQEKTEFLMAGIPLSSFLKAGRYTCLVSLSPFGGKAESFELPVEVRAKEFVSETIPLNSRNTSIRTNDSDERWRQIEKLNKILGTRNEKAVYDLGPYTAPTPATRRTSFFADRRVYAYSNGTKATSLHYGIDYGVPTGSEVRACARGRVVLAETRITTGWSTVIEHLPGLYSLYYHQSELKVKEGDIVERGQLIGLSGATGLATGPHLHWEMRLNMEAVSPDFFLGDFTFEQ